MRQLAGHCGTYFDRREKSREPKMPAEVAATPPTDSILELPSRILENKLATQLSYHSQQARSQKGE